jgi:hypothetical protein
MRMSHLAFGSGDFAGSEWDLQTAKISPVQCYPEHILAYGGIGTTDAFFIISYSRFIRLVRGFFTEIYIDFIIEVASLLFHHPNLFRFGFYSLVYKLIPE